MNRYIKNIHINKVRHLKDINISLEKDAYPHLMITGKNGSGKTSMLNAMAEYIEEFVKETNKGIIQTLKKEEEYDPDNILAIEEQLNIREKIYREILEKLSITFENLNTLKQKYQDGNFIIAFYEAHRTIKKLQEPKTPTKPKLQDKWGIKQPSTQEFLKFLADLKIQEALARNEKLEKDAAKLRAIFKESREEK